MSAVAAIGEGHAVEGFGLAGVSIHASDDPAEWIDAWHRLDPDVGLVLLTTASRATLTDQLAERSDVLWVVVA